MCTLQVEMTDSVPKICRTSGMGNRVGSGILRTSLMHIGQDFLLIAQHITACIRDILQRVLTKYTKGKRAVARLRRYGIH